MRYVGLITGALAVLFLGVSVHAGTQQFETGKPNVSPDENGNINGKLKITLTAKDGEQLESVTEGITNEDDAIDKAAKIQKEVDKWTKAGYPWGAVRDGNALTFWHRENGQKVPVPKIVISDNNTHEVETWTTLGANVGGMFEFGLDGSQLAAGADADGNPSFVAVATSAGAAYVEIQPGDRAENLIQGLLNQLQAAGVQVHPTSPTSFMILDLTPDGAFMSCQITDVAIPVQASGQVID